MSAPAEIDIVATENASDVFQEISSNFTEMSSYVSEASEAMSIDVSDSMHQTLQLDQKQRLAELSNLKK
jgi:hypothetical protein